MSREKTRLTEIVESNPDTATDDGWTTIEFGAEWNEQRDELIGLLLSLGYDWIVGDDDAISFRPRAMQEAVS